jgi:hypothetical protein
LQGVSVVKWGAGAAGCCHLPSLGELYKGIGEVREQLESSS